MPEKISQTWLLAHGFYMVHINPGYHGGFFRYYQDLPRTASTELVVSFENVVSTHAPSNDGYHHEDDFMVWLTTDMAWIPLRHARTIDDLQALNFMLRGTRIEPLVKAQ